MTRQHGASIQKLNGEFGSAFLATTFDDILAVGGFHSLAEAVSFLAFAFFGLISSFHGWCLFMVRG